MEDQDKLKAPAAETAVQESGGSDAAESDATSPWRKQLPKIVLGVVLAIVIIGGGYWWWLMRTTVSTDNARVVGDLVDISFTSSGKLEQVEVAEGDSVKAGQVVARLENSSQKAAVEQAQANLDLALATQERLPYDQESLAIAVTKSEAGVNSASTSVSAAEAGVNKAAAQVSAAEEQVNSAQYARDDAQRNYDINQELFNAGAVSQETLNLAKSRYETAQAAYNSASSNLVAAQAGYDSAEIGVETASDGVTSAEASLADSQQKLEASYETAGDTVTAQVRLARAALESARISLEKTAAASPINGAVIRIAVLEGESVSTGQSILTIADLEHTFVQANLEEKYIGRIQSGQEVDVDIDAYPDEDFKGKVVEIWDASQSTFAIISGESTSGNFTKVAQRIPVKIEVESHGFILKPGMSAVVTIHTP